MKSTTNARLQSDPDCCKLQSACKLESSKNNHLEQFADCRPQIAETPCNLPTNPAMTGLAGVNPDCTQTPYYYVVGDVESSPNLRGRDFDSSHLTVVDPSGARYRLIQIQANGVLVWQTQCVDCAADVVCTTGLTINPQKLPKRCHLHKSPGKASSKTAWQRQQHGLRVKGGKHHD